MTLNELERVEIALRRVLFEEEDAPPWVRRFADELKFLSEHHGNNDHKALVALA
jgi:hypothetical protein